MLTVLLLLTAFALLVLIRGAGDQNPQQVVTAIGLLIILLILWTGLVTVQPNQGKALLLFGEYKGTIKEQGLWWANPFFTKKPVSLRVRNFETTKLKVNDHNSNPIEIAAVVVWQVTDTAEALFEVDNYEEYVKVQSESALRGLANQYPYDAHEEGQKSLSVNTQEVAEKLKGEIQDRLAKAGVKVLEARVSHLAYAPEIAGVMLRRQQATAVIAARQKIVEGAVGMVELALEHLSTKQIVQLDEERKATMVGNLMVVLCSEQSTQPVVNAGTIY
ncbi:MAG TPA: SPFH domain-containing protein [Gemmatimonadales bacterium]|nr:SPFH domain-containing protein [Gemmatimonadales bacterium]